MGTNFTDRSIARLKGKEKRYIIFESGQTGFGIRVSPFNTKTFIYYYYFKKNKRLSIGRYPKIGLADARIKAANAQRLITEGIDPVSHYKDKDELETPLPTLKEVRSSYIENYAKLNKKSWQADYDLLHRIFDKDMLSSPAESLTRKNFRAIIDQKISDGHGHMANSFLAIMRKMLNYAVDVDMIPINPLAGMKKPHKPIPRKRVLTPPEIRKHWNEFHIEDTNILTDIALKMMLVTGQRKIEVLSIQKADIDFTNRIWIIPSTISKNKKDHLVPLTDLAIALLEDATNEGNKIDKDSEYYFPSSPRFKTHIGVFSVAEKVRNFVNTKGMDRYTPHDLRRTFATYTRAMARKHDYDRAYVGKILNHSETSITDEVYDMYDYFEEKLHVLTIWEKILKEILDGKINSPLALRQ